MRVSIASAIFTILLLTAASCGSDSEPADSSANDISADTLLAEVPEIVDEEEFPQETEANVPVTSGPEGSWNTTMGEIELVVGDTGNVAGEYPLGTIEGILTDHTLEFTYSESSLTGEGIFTFESDFNSFKGVQNIDGTEFAWDGIRI